jgi:hypothetical protein
MNPQVSDRLDAVLARALEPAPERRFQTAAEFAEALEGAVEPATRAEVSRYVEGLAWVSIREQRAILNEARPEDAAPRAALASEPKPEAELTAPDEDDLTLIPGSIPYPLNTRTDLVSHWAARRPEEATAVEKRPVLTPATPAPAAKQPSAPSIEFAAVGGEVHELPSAPSAPLATPIPAATRISSHASESFQQSRPRVRKMWLWPSAVLVAGLALAFALQFQPRARRAVRDFFLQGQSKSTRVSAPPAPEASMLTGTPHALITPPAPTPTAALTDAQSSERILRLDELPLLSESAKAKQASKAKVRSPRKARKRPAAAAPPSTRAEPSAEPEAEPPIILDP